jgi:hypothetical protein
MQIHTSLILEIFSMGLGYIFLYKEGGWYNVFENNLGTVWLNIEIICCHCVACTLCIIHQGLLCILLLLQFWVELQIIN